MGLVPPADSDLRSTAASRELDTNGKQAFTASACFITLCAMPKTRMLGGILALPIFPCHRNNSVSCGGFPVGSIAEVF